jgi:hypothetical protein
MRVISDAEIGFRVEGIFELDLTSDEGSGDDGSGGDVP